MRTIRKIERSVPNLRRRKKVAAYARVSMESERMHHSLSAQVSITAASSRRTRTGNTPGSMPTMASLGRG
jgi:hypothetical protein